MRKRRPTTEMWVRIDAVLQQGPRCFNEIGRMTDAPNAQLVARTLRRMMREGAVERRIIDARPPRSEYRLTDTSEGTTQSNPPRLAPQRVRYRSV